MHCVCVYKLYQSCLCFSFQDRHVNSLYITITFNRISDDCGPLDDSNWSWLADVLDVVGTEFVSSLPYDIVNIQYNKTMMLS